MIIPFQKVRHVVGRPRRNLTGITAGTGEQRSHKRPECAKCPLGESRKYIVKEGTELKVNFTLSFVKEGTELVEKFTTSGGAILFGTTWGHVFRINRICIFHIGQYGTYVPICPHSRRFMIRMHGSFTYEEFSCENSRRQRWLRPL